MFTKRHLKIDTKVLKFIEKYFNLNVKGHKVISPYFKRTGGFFTSKLYSGKDSPEHIEQEINSYLDKNKIHVSNPEDIRKIMQEINLGIECSGFVYQVINFSFVEVFNMNELKTYLPVEPITKPRKYISRKYRPECSVNANMFTSQPISTAIQLDDIQPYDFIRTRGGKHILLVIEVKYDNSKPAYIKFVHSSYSYNRDGVRYGEIFVSPDMKLINSTWNDNDQTEDINHAFKGYREKHIDNGVYRLNSMNLLEKA